MKPKKILVIAPYEGLAEMAQACGDRRDVVVDVVTGNLSDGVAAAKQLEKEGYDAIVSRGGTYEQIAGCVEIPVVDIEFSAYDMIRILRMADNISMREVIVGFPGIVKCAKIVSELLDKDIRVKTIHSEDEVPEALRKLRDENYNFIIGDQVVHNMAGKLNINSVLLPSGPESLQKAIDDAIKICIREEEARNTIQMLRKLLSYVEESVYVADESGKTIYSDRSMDDTARMQRKLGPLFAGALRQDSITTEWKEEGYIWRIKGHRFSVGEKTYLATISNKLCTVDQSEGTVVRRKTVQDMPELFYYRCCENNSIMQEVSENVPVFAQTLLPVIIYGENGVGKTNIAFAMHKESSKRKEPFFEIDCSRLSPRTFDKEFSPDRSEMYSKGGATLYFDDVSALAPESWDKVLQYLMSPSIMKHFRVLSSSTRNITELVEKKKFSRRLGSYLSELVITVPPLRERQENIDSIAGMIIHEFNMKYGKQVIGLEKKALDEIKGYIWPGNIEQLKRVIVALAFKCTRAYIGWRDVKTAIEREKSEETHINRDIDISRPLDDIISDIIDMVLTEENMNQTRTAKRLGISRSTLWRMMNR